MKHVLKTFRDDEDGAVAVDWVALTAAMVGLGVGVIAIIGDATDTATDTVVTSMEDAAPE